MTQNMEDAKEVAQETLIRAFKYLKRCDPERSFKNWLFQILVNAARSHLKQAPPLTKDNEISRIPDPGEAGPEQKHIRSEFRNQLSECLGVLSQREKEVFLLRDLEELSIKETAEALACSSISVRVHLSSARKKIKETIIRRYPHLAEGVR
jgi:RNA polymerase sigma-70 factor (ECF subfamily)